MLTQPKAAWMALERLLKLRPAGQMSVREISWRARVTLTMLERLSSGV
jgi:hypothetical protein